MSQLRDMAYCADGCGRVATTERLVGLLGVNEHTCNELVELVCVDCERATYIGTDARTGRNGIR